MCLRCRRRRAGNGEEKQTRGTTKQMIEAFKIRSVSDGSAWGWGPTRSNKCVQAAIVIAGLVTLLAPAVNAAPEKYQAYLSPVPHNDATLDNVRGKGTATVTLDGDTISIAATFAGLASPATKAVLLLSAGAGIPGKTVVKELDVTADANGKVSAQIKLDAAQLAALRGGKLYLQINSQKAPEGNLWGWFLPEHEVAGQDVPQKGPWYIPPFAVKTK
jgi:CHRD domain